MNEYGKISYKSYDFNGKKVFVVNKHHYVLPFWIYETRNKRYSLVSFDYHIDTMRMFRSYAYKKASKICDNQLGKDVHEEADKIIKDRFSIIDTKNHATVLKAVKDLKNDEHITVAYELGLLSEFHVINCMDDIPAEPGENLYKLDAHPIIFDKYRTMCIDDAVLNDLDFKIPKGNIILDFDLDYFPSRKAFQPQSCKIISKLIKRAEIITIAREPKWFDRLKTERGFKVDEAESLLLDFIERILSEHYE